MEKYPNPVTKQSHKKILSQMNNFFYKIDKKDEIKLGECIFLCIKYQNKNIPVLMTNYEIINEKYLSNNNDLDVLISNEIFNIEFESTKYLNKEYNLTMIEIKENKNNKINFIDIDEYLKEKDLRNYFYNESIYTLFYNKKRDIRVVYGIINYINKSEFLLSSNMKETTSFSPIFNLSNNKLIGIYKNNSKYYNKGIFLNFIISEFIKEYKNTKKYIQNDTKSMNIIDIKIYIGTEDINEKIYFLNYKDKNLNLEKLNDNETELYINNIKYEYRNYFIPEKEGKYHIKLKFNINLTDCSYMFYKCENIININFIHFNTKYVTNMQGMFYECTNLKTLNLFSFNMENVSDISYMFYGCKNLNNLDLSSFDIENVIDMNSIFYRCNRLKNLNNISSTFYKQNPNIKLENIFNIPETISNKKINSELNLQKYYDKLHFGFTDILENVLKILPILINLSQANKESFKNINLLITDKFQSLINKRNPFSPLLALIKEVNNKKCNFEEKIQNEINKEIKILNIKKEFEKDLYNELEKVFDNYNVVKEKLKISKNIYFASAKIAETSLINYLELIIKNRIIDPLLMKDILEKSKNDKEDKLNQMNIDISNYLINLNLANNTRKSYNQKKNILLSFYLKFELDFKRLFEKIMIFLMKNSRK